MISCSRWDIILVPFPFTDLTTSKKRPALVISPDNYNRGQDLIIAFITSQLNTKPRPGDYLIGAWRESGLPKPSMLRMKIATIDRNIVIKKLGVLVADEYNAVRDAIIDFFS